MPFRIFTVVAVVALAISTWILSSPARRPATSAAAGVPELPGYYLKDTVLTDYDAAGVPTLRIEADRIDQIAHTPEVALSRVRVDYLGQGGHNWVMYGDTAHVEHGGKEVSVTGNVRLQSDDAGVPAPVIHTDSLDYDVTEAIASTKSEVRIDFGAHSLTAHGLLANLKERTIRLEPKVNGRFQP